MRESARQRKKFRKSIKKKKIQNKGRPLSRRKGGGFQTVDKARKIRMGFLAFFCFQGSKKTG